MPVTHHQVKLLLGDAPRHIYVPCSLFPVPYSLFPIPLKAKYYVLNYTYFAISNQKLSEYNAHKNYIFSVSILLLVACNSKPEPSVYLPDLQCHGELPKQIKKNIGEYRLAQGSDFVKSIRSFDKDYTQEQLTCTIFTADFNCPAKEVPRCNL
ncbi:hypothetical protein [Moorena producens]|uniref:hypothetical protein n=1 Tax=Moorena producens TaxID=1155739 RepID=UPI000B1827DB|nr:hypothetical protein [Moorena producens]